MKVLIAVDSCPVEIILLGVLEIRRLVSVGHVAADGARGVMVQS